jgi:hypothetical protein
VYVHRSHMIDLAMFMPQNVLRKGPGNAVLVVPGGAAESLDAHPGTHSLTLKKRQVRTVDDKVSELRY